MNRQLLLVLISLAAGVVFFNALMQACLTKQATTNREKVDHISNCIVNIAMALMFFALAHII